MPSLALPPAPSSRSCTELGVTSCTVTSGAARSCTTRSALAARKWSATCWSTVSWGPRGRGEAAWNNMQVGAAPQTGHQVPCAIISLQCSRGQGWQGEAQAMMSDRSAQGTCYKSLLDTLERGILHISLDCWLQVTDTRPK